MTNEEEYISSRMGKRNPFTVPDGYFEHLTERVMQQLPAGEAPKAKVLSIRRLFYAAACVASLFVVGALAFHSLSDEQQPMFSENRVETVSNDEYLDEAADYAMMDNHEIYLCLMNE